MTGFNWIDWTILAIVTLSVITGLFRGFVKEVIALTVWVIAVWVSYQFHAVPSAYLKAYIANETVLLMASVLIVFLSVLLLGALLNWLFSLILKTSGLSGTDRLLGMVFGLVRGVLIVAVIMVAMRLTALSHDKQVTHSVLYVYMLPAADLLSAALPNVFDKLSVGQASQITHALAPSTQTIDVITTTTEKDSHE